MYYDEGFDVLAFDMRSHGRSEGMGICCEKERYDLALFVDYAVSLGYKSITLHGNPWAR